MGWIEVKNLSKVFTRRGKLSLIDSDDDDDEDDDVSPADPGQEAEEQERPPTKDSNAREVWALRDIDLRINAGEAVAVVGLTGSGKTTLIRILAGLSLPTSGEVRGKGLRIPLSFLRVPILSSATGRQNLAVLEQLFGMAEGRILDRAHDIAAFAGMEREIDQKVNQYSSSMYGKLALAAGLFCDPGILLVDERISGGDAPFRAKVLAKLKELVANGATLVYAGQSATGLPSTICRRMIWLANGCVVADGDTGAILPRYDAMSGADPSELADMRLAPESVGLEAIEVAPLTDAEQKPSSRCGVRLVPQQEWHAKVNLLETCWQRVIERTRATNKDKQVASGFFRAELSALAKVTDIRAVDAEGGLITNFPPGEAIRVELEVLVMEPKTEIGLRIELHTRGSLLFASDLPLPFQAGEPGRYMLSFPLQPWLMSQETKRAACYKILARVFLRRPKQAWEDMNVATVRLFVRGELRERFLLTGAVGQAPLSEPMPTWLDAVTPKPSPDLLGREPLLRPHLAWQIYRIEDACEDEMEDVSQAGQNPKGCLL